MGTGSRCRFSALVLAALSCLAVGILCLSLLTVQDPQPTRLTDAAAVVDVTAAAGSALAAAPPGVRGAQPETPPRPAAVPDEPQRSLAQEKVGSPPSAPKLGPQAGAGSGGARPQQASDGTPAPPPRDAMQGSQASVSGPASPPRDAAVQKPSEGSGGHTPARGGEALDKVHVCFCSDDGDLRPLAVAINSTVVHAADPSRLVLHIVTTAERAERVFASLTAEVSLQAAELRMHHDVELEASIQSLVAFRKSSGARKGLASPFNFAPFYMDKFLSKDGDAPPRIIYLDTDVVLMGDIAELHALDLQGMPVAAVEDCSQHFDIYINFKELKELGWMRSDLDPQACVFNRGVFIMDVAKWRQGGLSDDIELWMSRYRQTKKDIYKFGMSQPPWLLALAGRYHKLSGDWNCRGLGREFLNDEELKELKTSLGLNKTGLKAIGVRAAGTHTRPFIATCSIDAKLLHFNGAMKPWKRGKWDRKQRPPLCGIPGSKPSEPRTTRSKFIQCADLWASYCSPSCMERLPKGEEHVPKGDKG